MQEAFAVTLVIYPSFIFGVRERERGVIKEEDFCCEWEQSPRIFLLVN